MLSERQLQNFAELAVKIGVNMQKDQEVVIRADVKVKDFAHLIAQKAYENGAKYVHLQWRDEEMSRLHMQNANEQTLCDVPQFTVDELHYYVDRKCCLISISAGNPDIYLGLDADKIAKVNAENRKKTKFFSEATMSNYLRWTIVSVPTPEWAKKVFPDVSTEEAIDKMWNTMGKIMRLDSENPTLAWREHINKLQSRAKYLNQCNFEYLHFTNNSGTNLKIGLALDHEWLAAEEKAQDGVSFTANMPTEEIFTAPHNKKIDGTVVNALPLVYNGNVIDDFCITFANGKVTNYTAKKGYDILKGLLQADEGALSLGEVALIGKGSPIAQSGVLFFNTLFDENASCHLAFGASYPTTIKNGNDLTDLQCLEKGANDSTVHVDFMVGTKDLCVDGIDFDGKITPLMRDGEWVI